MMGDILFLSFYYARNFFSGVIFQMDVVRFHGFTFA